MSRTAAAPTAHTYVPDVEDALILDFAAALEAAGRRAPEAKPSLVDADGRRLELPDAMYDVLRQVAEALASGMGVTVAPMNALLTTQEAADYLGVSRPTLVRILERGDLPMERPGRHRFVRLSDLVAFQAAQRKERRGILKRMQQEGHEDGLYAVTDGAIPPPADQWRFRSSSTHVLSSEAR